MERVITEKDYPIEQKWVVKILLKFFIFTVIIFLFFLLLFIPIAILNSEVWLFFLMVIDISYYIVAIIILLIINAFLFRNNFHYSIEKEFMVFSQGIITKQQKNLPYGVIQDLIIHQDIADRIFGLASLTIENASFGGGQVNNRDQLLGVKIGFVGNVVTIPGLTKQNAETLKNILLSKIKKYSTTNNRSGL